MAAVIVAVVTASLIYRNATLKQAFEGPPCSANANDIKVGLDLEQADHATTIAAVGKKLGLPDHSVTVALATAFQESGLRNLDHGDRDSVGLFQQRPSQGWGTEKQLMTPQYAATKFYASLAEVKGWNDMSVTDAAQAVQRSAAPNAYAQWEPQSRVIAQALTGQVAAGFGCRVTVSSLSFANELAGRDLKNELGSNDLGKTLPDNRGWVVAGWLVGHAQQYGVRTVDFAGKRWTAKSDTWQDHGPKSQVVRVNA